MFINLYQICGMAPLEAQVSHVYKPLTGLCVAPLEAQVSHVYKPLTDLWRGARGGTSLTCLKTFNRSVAWHPWRHKSHMFKNL